MAGSLNKVMLLGNLGADPEIRNTKDGRPIATLSLATSESWKDKNSGERRERTEWHRVVIFAEGLCRVVEQYVRKGSKLFIEGELRTRKWQDKSGADRYTTEVVIQGFNGRMVMLDSRRDGERMGDRGGGDRDGGGDRARSGGDRSGGSESGRMGDQRSASAAAGAGAGAERAGDEELDDKVPF